MRGTAPSLLNDLSSAVSDFQVATLGAYPGPSMPFSMLREAMGTVDGLNTSALVSSTQAAVTSSGGSSNKFSVKGIAGEFLLELVVETFGEIADGRIATTLEEQLDSFTRERDDADNIATGVEGCARAIDNIVDTSDSFMSEVIGAVTPVIQILTAVLRRTPPGRLAALIIPIAAGLIDNTMGVLSAQCRDRDTSIDQCFEEMERRCDEMLNNNPPCECPDTAPAPAPAPKPQPQPQPEVPAPVPGPVSEPAPAPAPEPVSGPGDSGTLPPAKPVGPLDPVTTPVSTAPAPSTPTTTMPECAQRVTQAVTDFQDCAQRTHAAVHGSIEAHVNGAISGAVNDAQKAINSVSSSCWGTLGLVGAGVAAVGLGIAAYTVADCMGLTDFDCSPEQASEQAPEPAPAPAPEPTPAPAPEPVTKPVTDDSVIEPPAELSEVEEPAPPPKKQPVPESAPEVVPAPEAAPAPERAPESSSESSSATSSTEAQSSVQQSWERARKAGQW